MDLRHLSRERDAFDLFDDEDTAGMLIGILCFAVFLFFFVPDVVRAVIKFLGV